MSKFSRKLTVTKVGDGIWMVEKPFSYRDVFVNAGFITDFASSPRWSWWLIPPDGPYCQATVLHDKLYQSHEMSRKDSDYLFYQAMKSLKVPKWKRELMYWAVRLFGLSSWKEYQPSQP